MLDIVLVATASTGVLLFSINTSYMPEMLHSFETSHYIIALYTGKTSFLRTIRRTITINIHNAYYNVCFSQKKIHNKTRTRL